MAGLIQDSRSDEISLLQTEDDNLAGPDNPEDNGPWTDLRLPEYIQPGVKLGTYIILENYYQ